MNKTVIALLLLFLLIERSFSQQIRTVKIKDVETLLTHKSGKIQVINFWATWCAPCVKEMPFFEALNKNDKTVDVTLISMDLQTDDSSEKIYKFAKEKKIASTILILDEPDANSWIDKVDTKWSGALPATIVVNTQTGKRKLVERELHEGELEEIIKQLK